MSVEDYCTKVRCLKGTDVNELNQIIDQLNASHHFDFSTENEAIEDLLCSLATIVPSGNDHLLSKFCSLLYVLIHKQKIALQHASVEKLITFITTAICSCGAWVQSDTLIALSAIIEDNADKIKKFYDRLVGKNGILINLLAVNGQDKSIQYNAFHCLLNLVKNSGENSLQEELLDLCYQKCLIVLKESFVCNTTDVFTLKIVICSLKCLQHICASKSLIIRNFGEFLGSLKSLLFYGLPGQSFTSDINLQPTLRYPDTPHHLESQSESDSPFPKLRKQKKNKRRLKKTPQKKQSQNVPSGEEESDYKMVNISNGIANVSLTSSKKSFHESKMKSSSSDSELSDAESHISKLKSLQSSVRQNAYLALQDVIKTSDKKVIFGYWSSFLPEHPSMPGIILSQNIFTTILKDPVPQVRLCALTFLAEILRGSKQFLSLADGRNVRHISFTSLSSILATMISEIHRCLLLTLLSESSNLLLTQILKCYAVLAENVPYNKLNADILFKFLRPIRSFLCHKDIQVQVACLAVFGSIISSDQTPSEIEELMLSPDFDCAIGFLKANSTSDSRPPLNLSVDQSPWIIEMCKKNIFSEDPLPIKLQTMQLLSNIVGKYFHRSQHFFPIMDNIVIFCLNNPDTSMQLHGAKLLDVLGRCMNNITNPDLEKNLQPLMSTLWENVLMGSLIKCLTNDDFSTLQSVCCDCLSTLTSKNFESLPPKQQIFYVTVLLGLASDSNPNTRGAAIRCLGLYCLFPCLTQDPSFLDDVSVILIKAVKDPNMNVRFKASWSLGNLSDALFLNRDKFLLSKEISSQFFYSIGMACVQFSKDNDRIKANAVRALGNFLNYIPEEFINLPMMHEFIRESCEVLKSALSANFMKVCWNSCYALGNMLKNVYLIEHCIINLEEILKCLLNVLKSPNFKVRISAAQALTSMTSRLFYGNLFTVVWKNLVSALFSISADVNFKEVKHQENLNDQLCFSLCQLTTLITSEDVTTLAKNILDSREMLLTSMWKLGSHMMAEKNMIVSIAVEKITSLREENTSCDIDTTLMVLLDILNQTIIAFYKESG